MKEIMIPVLLLDDDCKLCDELDVISECKCRIYADDDCIEQEITVRCNNIYKCQRMLKRLEKKNG